MGRLGIQAAKYGGLNCRIEILHQRRRTERRSLAMQPHQLGQRGRFECPPSSENFVEHQAERIDIALHRDFSTGQLLRRHVGGSAIADLFARDFVGERGEAEIGDHHLAAAVEHDVGGLQIAMQHTLA